MPLGKSANDASPGVTRPLRNIYTYGGRPARRNLTVADIRANKAAGVKMTQVSAQTRDEVEVLEAPGIDLITIADLDIDESRAGAPHTFVTGSQTIVQYVTEDEALAAAMVVIPAVWSCGPGAARAPGRRASRGRRFRPPERAFGTFPGIIESPPFRCGRRRFGRAATPG